VSRAADSTVAEPVVSDDERLQPLAKEPTGVYLHSDGRPLLGRKLQGKSHRELHDLGLVADGGQASPAAPAPTTGGGSPYAPAIRNRRATTSRFSLIA